VPVPVQLVVTPSSYLAGEESALVHFLNGGPPKPTFLPPRPFERGVAKRPTLVQNLETLAHLALIARYGAEWFREAGTTGEPGTALVTLSGAVTEPGVYEIGFGTSLRDLLGAAGGATAPVRAVLLGGYFGSWLDVGVARDVILHEEHLRPLGGGLGSGVIAILPDDACGAAESARVLGYLAVEAAGQCGPCTNGLGALAEAVMEMVRGRAGPQVEEDLARWSAIVPGRGACHHPDGAVRFALSALDVFAEEFAQHRQRGPCAHCSDSAVLPIPRPAANGRLR
jgi:NADH:ubiquinone oxidoreductase subunit F (NADH-binding)